MQKSSFWQTIAIPGFMSMLVVACGNQVTQNPQTVNNSQQNTSKTQIDYGDIIVQEKSDYLMIPVYIKDEGGFFGSSSYKRGASTNNYIFERKEDGETNILLNKKAIIDSFQLLETQKADPKQTNLFLLYNIIDKDTNEDKKLDQNDAVIAYISDLSGKNLKQLTPNNTKMINSVLLPSQNAVIIKILKDTNNDKKFTSEDTVNFVRVNLNQPEIGKEIITNKLDQEIKSYMSK
ncbi:MAG TPA: hypothetical protein VK184_12245 [Nostocaceae cyanobacterium]|nr:hypothetical protein [Nostocaceae cyanobacterium]